MAWGARGSLPRGADYPLPQTQTTTTIPEVCIDLGANVSEIDRGITEVVSLEIDVDSC